MKQIHHIWHFLLIGIFFNSDIIAQSTHDTVTIFQYNLLNYGYSTSYCNVGNNNIQDKDEYLRHILTYTRPDIVGFNEIGANSFYINNLQTEVFDDDTISIAIDYDSAPFANNGFSNLVNGFFYNAELFGLYSQDKIEKDINGISLVRQLDVYTLYYKDPLLSETPDRKSVV